jgi:hypothetical protein
MSRKACRRRVTIPLPPRGLRPKLHASDDMVWHWAGSVLTWSKVAELLGVGTNEMAEQLRLSTRLVERFGRTGRLVFSGPDYQLAKLGIGYMDDLAELVDHPTAVIAAAWSEAQLQHMAATFEQVRAEAARITKQIAA